MAAWNETEVTTIVADYFDMLRSEIQGERYNKTEHRRSILPLLDGRSHGSIELKHQNISALMIELGMPYINGYKPKRNYQKNILPDAVLDYLVSNPDVQELMAQDVEVIPETLSVESILDALESPPVIEAFEVRDEPPLYRPVKRNFLQAEAENRRLGLAGEEFVLNYERARLIYEGRETLAEKIEHTSLELGDGAGFDIRSFNEDGTDRFIEAKTTKYGKETPFYISNNEVSFSQDYENSFHLYRVFEFRNLPRLYCKQGSVSKSFSLTPTMYSAKP